MKILEIIRLEEWDQGTIGVLKIDKSVFCYTLEPNDLLNIENKSSIPAQQYTIKIHESPKYGVTYKVENVPDRDNILFHPGNTNADTAGCIILGQVVGSLKSQRALLNSGYTFKEFIKTMDYVKKAHLTIREVY